MFEPGVRDATRDLPQVPGSDIIAANRPLEILGLQQVPRGAALHVHPGGRERKSRDKGMRDSKPTGAVEGGLGTPSEGLELMT